MSHWLDLLPVGEEMDQFERDVEAMRRDQRQSHRAQALESALDVQVPYRNQLEQYGFVPANHEKPNWFPVDAGRVYDAKGNEIPGYLRVFREDTGDVLAVHSDSYTVISYRDVFDMFDAALADSDLDTEGMMVGTDMTHNGARCFRQYVLPRHQIDLGNGDRHALRIIGFNSYDGSMAASLMAGGYRFTCANMSVIGRHLVQLKVRHAGKSTGVRLEDGIGRVVEAADHFVRMEPRYRRWKEVPVVVEGFKDLVGGLPQITERLTDHLVAKFATEKEEGTLYGAWNILTNWATHADTKAHKAQTTIDRQKRVATLIDGRAWKVLEDA